jgi:hypothetical protein
MTQPTLKIILNWANEGDTPDLVDLTANTVQTSISRGRNIIQDLYEVGTATFRVLDPDGRWNPQNLSSPYSGKIVPLRQVNMYATWLGVDYPIFAGFTITYDYTYPKDQEFGYITIRCEDAFRLFNMAAVSTVTGGIAGQTTGQRINSILDQIGWSATARDIDAGLTLCQADPGTVRPALQALRTVEFTEGLGAFYMSADGKATFRNRQNTIIGFAPRTTQTNLPFNPSFENPTDPIRGWTRTNPNTLIESYALDSYMGTRSASITRLTANSSGLGMVNTRVVPVSARQSCTAGDVLNVSAYFKRVVGVPNFRIRVVYYTSLTGTGSVSSANGTVVTGSTSWTKVSSAFTVPSGLGITHVDLQFVFGNNGIIGDQMLVDAVVMQKNAATITPFPFDGESSLFPTNYAANTNWLGTPYDSGSQVSYLTYPVPTTFNQDGTGIGYQNIVFALDDKLLVNQAQFTRLGGSPQTNTNAASVAKYFVHSINKPDLLMQTDDLALDLAQAYVAGREDTEIRIENLTLMLNGITDSDDMISVIDIDYFDKVLISNNQPGGSTITETLFVQGLSHDITPNRWITTIKTYESLLDGLVLNDNVKGTLDYNVLGY